MEQLVKVKKNLPGGKALVLHIRQSACSGECHKCAGCGAAQESLELTVQDPIGVKPGDVVVIRGKSGPVLAAAAVTYMLPLAMFFLGCLLGAMIELTILAGGIGFVLGIGLAVLYDRLVARKQQTVYTITGYGQFPKAWENEE